MTMALRFCIKPGAGVKCFSGSQTKTELAPLARDLRSVQGCDLRTRGNLVRGLKNSLQPVFTRHLRGIHVRYIYGAVLKYTANTGESVFLLVVGGRRVFKFRVWCACLSLYSLFAPFPPALCLPFSCSVHRHGPWLCAYRQVRNVTENFE